MEPLVEVKGLKKYFKASGGFLHAVDDVTLSFEKGKTMGIVGESGCGKSTLGRTIVHLYDSTAGQIFYEGRDVTNVDKEQLRELRKNMQIIFQDPYASLNPRLTVEETLKEPLVLSRQYKKKDIEKQVARLMDFVGIPARLRMAYPHEMDGGRRQRVGIGRALAMNPKFICCDEPVSALDVSIQAQVLNLLQELQQELNLTYMFVTHDLSVVRHISHAITVMYLGQVVETGPVKDIFYNPQHPYTQALLSAIPSTDIDNPHEQIVIQGEITSPINPKPGCRFADRCPYVKEKCRAAQTLMEVSVGHLVACCRVGELNTSDKKL